MQRVERGDLVRVAQRFSGNWGSERAPVFNDGSAALGVVTEIDRQEINALVLIDGHPTWVVRKNLEAVNEAG
jgi:hypothetical protein